MDIHSNTFLINFPKSKLKPPHYLIRYTFIKANLKAVSLRYEILYSANEKIPSHIFTYVKERRRVENIIFKLKKIVKKNQSKKIHFLVKI